MPLKILLVSSNLYTTPDPVFPLGLAYVADSLIQAGHSVFFVDLLYAAENWHQEASAFHPNLVGISVRNVDEVCMSSKGTLLGELPALVSLCRNICKGPIVLGGPAVSLFPGEILRMSGADYAIKGEGEQAFRHICDTLQAGRSPSAPWLLSREELSDAVNQGSLLSPAPAGFCTYFDIDIRSKIAPHYLVSSRMLNIQTQRGCPMKCCYCTYPVLEGRNARYKPVETVIEEMRLIQKLGANYFFIVDGVFNTSRNRVVELCEAMIRANLKLRWGCFIKPSNIDPELAALMARAGMCHAECGSDSLSDTMLTNYGKQFSFKDIWESSMNLMKADIRICHFIIFGGPGETRETMAETFARSREIPGGIFFSSTGLRVYPNTPLYDTLVKCTPKLANISMLEPYYYLSPSFTADSIEAEISAHAHGRSEWILSSRNDNYQANMLKMRKKGKTGPLWDYMELMQRLSK
ncbi:MAG: lipid biosynthesis B12-binding/radical SAM protein [Opitutales bacterium]